MARFHFEKTQLLCCSVADPEIRIRANILDYSTAILKMNSLLDHGLWVGNSKKVLA